MSSHMDHPTERSTLVNVMRDMVIIRPRIALALSVITLCAALITTLVLLRATRSAADTVFLGGSASAALHSYAAALEVWRDMAERGDPRMQRPTVGDQRDSIRAALTVHFKEWRAEQSDSGARALTGMVLESLREREVGLNTEARRAVAMLHARQDVMLMAAAERSREAVPYTAILFALAVIAAGTLIVPMLRFYMMHRRAGIPGIRAELIPKEARR